MKPFACALLAASLLLGVACDRSLGGAFLRQHDIAYAPTEVGLTLVYVDPTLPQEQQFQERRQRRVSAVRETPEGRVVTLTYTSLQNTLTLEFISRDGGWRMPGDRSDLILLPEGFPDRSADHWKDEARGLSFEVIGRGAVTRKDLVLPEAYMKTGVWVEMTQRNGNRTRILYLPGIGEAETQEFRDGKWVVVYQLVNRGFTEAPTVAPEEPAPVPPKVPSEKK